MCGIAGIFSYKNPIPVDLEELSRMSDYMRVRGPDGKGMRFSSDRRAGVAHRRLAIIDLSDNAAQPMVNEEMTLTITFNGEIYNYRELRIRLEKSGYRFRSNSDAEVLLHLYHQKGESMLGDLRGMFAFAIWDEKKKKFFLARDAYGIKPLYYADDGKTVRFASTVKALMSGGKISRNLSAAGQVGFLLFGSVPEPVTIYEDVQELKAGCMSWIDAEGMHIKEYFSIRAFMESLAEEESAEFTKDAGNQLRNALLDSLKYHFVSDVPVGVFLSAGIDSGSLVALAKDAGINNISTVTVTAEEFRGKPEDEAPLARKIAERYGTEHHEFCLSRQDFQQEIPHIFDAMDQPSIDGINTYFVSRFARQSGFKAALSGLGGDELFGGYPSFKNVPRMADRLGAFFKSPMSRPEVTQLFLLLGQLIPGFKSKYAGLFQYGGDFGGAYFLQRGVLMPWELRKILDRDTVEEGLLQLGFPKRFFQDKLPQHTNSFNKVAALETTLYMRNQLLRDADWAGMAHSLEIRVPYVDSFLLKALGPLLKVIASEGKRLLAEAASLPLPESIVCRPKTGFSLPFKQWLRDSSMREPSCGAAPSEVSAGHWSRRWACDVLKGYLKT